MRKNTERRKRHTLWLDNELAYTSVLALVILPCFQLLSHASLSTPLPEYWSTVLEPLTAQLSQPISEPNPECQGRTWGSQPGTAVAMATGAEGEVPLVPPIPLLAMCSAWARRICQAWPCEGSSGNWGGKEKQWELGILYIK